MGYIISAALFLALFFYSGMRYQENFNQLNKPEIKPCACVSAKTYRLYYERYEMHLNKRNKDSVAKYAILLNF